MGVNKVNLQDVKTNTSETVLNIKFIELTQTLNVNHNILLPLKHEQFNKKYVELILESFCEKCDSISCMVLRMNNNMKIINDYLNDYSDKNGMIKDNIEWEEDDEGVKTELIRVLIKAMKEINGEILQRK